MFAPGDPTVLYVYHELLQRSFRAPIENSRWANEKRGADQFPGPRRWARTRNCRPRCHGCPVPIVPKHVVSYGNVPLWKYSHSHLPLIHPVPWYTRKNAQTPI